MARILVASDRLTGRNFSELLSADHHVEAVEGGVDCIQRLRASNADLLILDQDLRGEVQTECSLGCAIRRG
jgi:hypothetical protein